MGTDESAGFNGCFYVPRQGQILRCIVSDGSGWEHVSVSTSTRCPTWEEMCYIKDLFWKEDERVVQYHPPKEEYVNNHKFCLHLWRSTEQEFPFPPKVFVGV